MILLALDTCDPRGSLAILRDEQVLSLIPHAGAVEYSSWILPNAEAAFGAAGLKMWDMDVLAVASGPGSFTGVRIGLTSVKAWGEAYGKPTAGISRLEAIASEAVGNERYVAAVVDAQRDQVFGGLYRRQGARLTLVGEEMVVDPAGFLKCVSAQAGADAVSWISMDPEKLETLDIWAERARTGETMQRSTHVLAPSIGRLGRLRALDGRLTDALGLDAQYVRRSDAEIFWKGGAERGR